MDLQKFCSQDDTRTNINKPFSQGVYTYATNNHVIIRVPRLPDVPEQIENKVDVASIEKFIGDYPYYSIPDTAKPTKNECPLCDGTGTVKVCPECDGTGKLTFTSAYNDYDVDCESCNGTGFTVFGKIEPTQCPKCEGSGKIIRWERSRASGRLYNNQYLSWLKELPECLLAEAKGYDPAHFKFNGGDGWIMPLKEEYAGHIQNGNI